MERYDLSQDTLRFCCDIELYGAYFTIFTKIWKECKENIEKKLPSEYSEKNYEQVITIVNEYISIAVNESIEILRKLDVNTLDELMFVIKYNDIISYEAKIRDVEKDNLGELFLKAKECILGCLDSLIDELKVNLKIRRYDLKDRMKEDAIKKNAMYYEELITTGKKLSLDRYYNMRNNEIEEVKGTTICLIITNIIMIMILCPLYILADNLLFKAIIVAFLFVSLIILFSLAGYYLVEKIDEKKILKKLQEDYYKYYGISK